MYTLCILLAATATGLSPQTPKGGSLAQSVPAADSSVQVTWGVRIPMRDGIVLNAAPSTVPPTATAPLPGGLRAHAVHLRHVQRSRDVLRAPRLPVRDHRRARPRQLGRYRALHGRRARRLRHRRVARAPELVQRQGRDVGRLVCRARTSGPPRRSTRRTSPPSCPRQRRTPVSIFRSTRTCSVRTIPSGSPS